MAITLDPSELVENFRSAITRFTNDLKALSEENAGKCWGGVSRCAFDFAYEMVLIHERTATLLRGEDPGPPPWKFGEEWVKAPDSLRTIDAMSARLNESVETLLAAIGDDFEKKVKMGETEVPVWRRLQFLGIHTMYHDAQLNFMQAMAGDGSVHW